MSGKAERQQAHEAVARYHEAMLGIVQYSRTAEELGKFSSALLVVTAEQPPPTAQQFQLRPGRDQAFGGVEHLLQMIPISRDQGDPNHGASMKLQVIHLSGRHVETSTQVGDQWTDE